MGVTLIVGDADAEDLIVDERALAVDDIVFN